MNATRPAKKITKGRRRLLQLILCLAYFHYGIISTVWNPINPDLETVIELNQDQMKWGLTISLVSFMFTCLSSSFLFKFWNRTLVYGICMTISGVALATSCAIKGLAWFCVTRALIGLSSGIIDTVSNVWTIELWSGSSKCGSALQAMVMSYSIGEVVVAFVSQYFVAVRVPSSYIINQNNTFASRDSTELYSTVATEEIFERTESRIGTLLIVLGCSTITMGILLIVTGFVWSEDRVTKLSSENKKNDKKESEKVESTITISELPGIIKENRSKIIRIALIGLLIMFGEGAELTTVSYFVKFLTCTKLKLDTDYAIQMQVAMSCVRIVMLLVGSVIALFVKPAFVLIADFTILITANCLFYLFMDTNLTGTWIAALLMAGGFATMFGSLWTLTESLMEVTNFVGAVCIVGGVVSGAIYPLFIGGSIDENPIVLVNQNLSSFAAALATLFVIMFYVRFDENHKKGQGSLVDNSLEKVSVSETKL